MLCVNWPLDVKFLFQGLCGIKNTVLNCGQRFQKYTLISILSVVIFLFFSVLDNIKLNAEARRLTRPPANDSRPLLLNPYPTAFPYGNGMVLHFYQQQEISTTKTVHKVINRGLKTYV